jgi:hypothetical protein
MGEASANMLLGLLQSAQEPQAEVKIRGRLIIRESCGADPALREPPIVTPRRRWQEPAVGGDSSLNHSAPDPNEENAYRRELPDLHTSQHQPNSDE